MQTNKLYDNWLEKSALVLHTASRSGNATHLVCHCPHAPTLSVSGHARFGFASDFQFMAHGALGGWRGIFGLAGIVAEW